MSTKLLTILSATTLASFFLSFFCNIAVDNADQYLAVIAVAFMDGFFGIIAGIKREGFKTYKAIKVLRTTITWIFILTVVLFVEKGFKGTSWLSETLIGPFVIFQIISALKNASLAGFIQHPLLNRILRNIDKHKDKVA